MAEAILFDRAQIQLINSKKIRAIYDFAYGEYLAQANFFSEFSRVQSELINTGTVTLDTGTKADLNTLGGTMGLNIYMETLDSTKEAMSGLAKLGLKNENKLWTMQ